MSEQQPINIDRLLIELDRAGNGWNSEPEHSDFLRGIIRRAAAGIRQLQNSSTMTPDENVRRYLGMILKEVGERLAPDA